MRGIDCAHDLGVGGVGQNKIAVVRAQPSEDVRLGGAPGFGWVSGKDVREYAAALRDLDGFPSLQPA